MTPFLHHPALLLAACSALLACAGAGDPRPGPKPVAACGAAPFAPPGMRRLEGWADGPMSVDAIQRARTNALIEGLKRIAVTVGGEFVDIQVQSNGRYTSYIRDRQTSAVRDTAIRGAQPLGQPCVRAATGGVVVAWMAVPEAEWGRVAIQARGATLLAYRCQADPAEACDGAGLAAMQAAAAAAGLSLTHAAARLGPGTGSPPSGDELRRLATEHEAAHVLLAELSARFLGENEGEVYATARAGLWLIDGFEAKILRTLQIPDTKGGHYNRKDAAKAALKRACEQAVTRARELR